MKRAFPSAVFAIAAFAFSHFGALAQTNVIIVPRERATSFGSWSGGLFGGKEFLQLYSQDEFVELPVVVAITGIAFRWDENYQQPFEAIAGYTILQMGISNGQGDTFEDYLPNPTLVFKSENLRFVARDNRGPNDFEVAFIFQKPFVYAVGGPYTIEERADIVEINPGRKRAILLARTQNRFYKIVVR